MNSEKIAILIDSCTDVPKEYIDKYNMYTLPLLINYSDGEYRDGIDITAQEVYDRFSTEIPKTSLPNMGIIQDTFKKIIEDGYNKILAITISSGLSGTFNAVRMVAEEVTEAEVFMLDTKNIGIGAGFTPILAGELIEKGLSFDEIKEKLIKSVEDTKIYFCVETLEYLRKGGRIGLVSSVLGTTLNLKPIISCNEDGIYYTVSKARGRKKSLSKALEHAKSIADKYSKYNVAVVHGNAKEEADALVKEIKETFPNVEKIFEGQISPALVVHTGPGLIGIGIQGLE